jgi:hypothetical protein
MDFQVNIFLTSGIPVPISLTQLLTQLPKLGFLPWKRPSGKHSQVAVPAEPFGHFCDAVPTQDVQLLLYLSIAIQITPMERFNEKRQISDLNRILKCPSQIRGLVKLG